MATSTNVISYLRFSFSRVVFALLLSRYMPIINAKEIGSEFDHIKKDLEGDSSILLTELECFFERSGSVETIALLVGRAREDRKLVNRHLSSDAGKKSPATKLEFFRPLTNSS